MLVRTVYGNETVEVSGPATIHIYPDFNRRKCKVTIDADPSVKIKHHSQIHQPDSTTKVANGSESL